MSRTSCVRLLQYRLHMRRILLLHRSSSFFISDCAYIVISISKSRCSGVSQICFFTLKLPLQYPPQQSLSRSSRIRSRGLSLTWRSCARLDGCFCRIDCSNSERFVLWFHFRQDHLCVIQLGERRIFIPDANGFRANSRYRF